jgi:hypothetical protein
MAKKAEKNMKNLERSFLHVNEIEAEPIHLRTDHSEVKFIFTIQTRESYESINKENDLKLRCSPTRSRSFLNSKRKKDEIESVRVTCSSTCRHMCFDFVETY